MPPSSSSSSSPSTGAGAKMQQRPPCRLTYRPPNNDAYKLYQTTMKQARNDLGVWTKYGVLIVSSSIGFLVGFGLAIWAKSFLSLLFCWGILTVIGGLIQCCYHGDSATVANSVDNRFFIRRLIHDTLKERCRDDVLLSSPQQQKYKSILMQLQQTTRGINFAASNYSPVGKLLPYNQMNSAGVVPASSITAYEIAWEILEDGLVLSGLPASQQIISLHKDWLDILNKSVKLAYIINEMYDKQKVTSTNIANGGNDKGSTLSTIIGTGTELMGLTGVAGDDDSSLTALFKQVKELKDTLADLQEINNNLPESITVSGTTTRRSGIHAILVCRLILIYLFYIGLGMFSVIMFATYDKTVGTILSVVIMIGFCFVPWYFQRGWNSALNAMEDLVVLESYARHALEYEINKNIISSISSSGNNNNNKVAAASITPVTNNIQISTIGGTIIDVKDLIETLNVLRNEIMESYYDTLGIHCHTHLMTFGDVPPQQTSVPYFWTTTANHNGNATNITASAAATTPPLSPIKNITTTTTTTTAGGSVSPMISPAAPVAALVGQATTTAPSTTTTTTQAAASSMFFFERNNNKNWWWWWKWSTCGNLTLVMDDGGDSNHNNSADVEAPPLPACMKNNEEDDETASITNEEDNDVETGTNNRIVVTVTGIKPTPDSLTGLNLKDDLDNSGVIISSMRLNSIFAAKTTTSTGGSNHLLVGMKILSINDTNCQFLSKQAVAHMLRSCERRVTIRAAPIEL